MNLASGFNRHPFAADRAQPLLSLKNVQQLNTPIQSVAQLVRLAFLKVHLPFEGKGICFGLDFHKSLYFPILFTPSSYTRRVFHLPGFRLILNRP